MAYERDLFCCSGPLHLTRVDWDNAEHQKSVAACLVQGVYLLERNRQGFEALDPLWWGFFHFGLDVLLVDDADNSIFGAVYKFEPSASSDGQTIGRSSRYVIAFRGNLLKLDSFYRDLKLDLHLILNELHQTSRSKIAMQFVRDKVPTVGNSDIWLAGHSLGSAIAMQAGKMMANNGIFLKTFLFNPPFIALPIERIEDKRLQQILRIAGSVIKAAYAFSMNQYEDSFIALSGWIPWMFVNPGDFICSGYIGYFEHREYMEKMGAGFIEGLATQNSFVGLSLNAFGKETDPLHLIPSANLIFNQTPQGFKQAHGIHQWWQPEMQLPSKLFIYRQSSERALVPFVTWPFGHPMFMV